jgi:tetratricopeptide (TPR) repeat protein
MSQWDMARPTDEERIDEARRAIARGDWSQALDALEIVPATESAELLELRAAALYGAGDFEGCVGSWEDLHSLCVRRGDEIEAGRVAAMVAMYLMMDTGLMAPVRGWLRCADRHLDGVDDHPVRAIVAMVRAYERFMCGSMTEARAQATLAIELGERFGVVPAVVIGRTCSARLTIFDGDVAMGLELLDEVGALLMSGAADPLTTGMMYCEIICAAQGLLMPDLAAQWTEVMERWRHGAAVGGINGRCRVHRAEVLRVSGTCDLAEAEAVAACEELRPWMRREFGWPLVELGNVRLRSGDLDGAEQAFREAAALAWSPQPGLALVHLARGDAHAAAAMIAHAITYPIDIPSKERPPFGPLRLAPLYDAQATIAYARRDRATLERAAGELTKVAGVYPSPMLRGNELLARARLALLDAAPERAIGLAGRAVAEFQGVGAPFEAALARLVVADGYEAAGRADDAAIEQRAARDALASFGAHWWADRVHDSRQPPWPNPWPNPWPSPPVHERSSAPTVTRGRSSGDRRRRSFASSRDTGTSNVCSPNPVVSSTPPIWPDSTPERIRDSTSAWVSRCSTELRRRHTVVDWPTSTRTSPMRRRTTISHGSSWPNETATT